MSNLKEIRSKLLQELVWCNPNAYVKVGEVFHPARSELFNFEMFRKAKESGLYKYHEGLPIILTLEESQKEIYFRFEEYLIKDIKIPFDASIEIQLGMMLFLRSICSDGEILSIIQHAQFVSNADVLDPEVWRELMNYELDLGFLRPCERREICMLVHRGRDFGDELSTARDVSYRRNEYAQQIQRLTDVNVENLEPLLAKALRFYKVTLVEFQKEYPYHIYSGTGGLN